MDVWDLVFPPLAELDFRKCTHWSLSLNKNGRRSCRKLAAQGGLGGDIRGAAFSTQDNAAPAGFLHEPNGLEAKPAGSRVIAKEQAF
ncbi:MAG TPA: hypothetical protein VNW30_03895 [Opitutaceae bacterium]|nr:hypothetical protein [Opitutaceae bacterium]